MGANVDNSLQAQVTRAIRRARWDDFTDGMISRISEEIEGFVHKYHGAAVNAIESVLGAENIHREVAAEVLKTLGHVTDPETYQQRLALLMRFLGAPSTWVRDGALTGLSWLNDPASLPALRKAVQVETVEELRRDIEAVVSEIEADGE